MSCQCQCTNTLYLCKFSICNEIDLGVQSDKSGAYELRLDHLGNQIVITEDFLIGNDIKFPASGLNENFMYIGELYDPDGDKVTKIIDGVEYDCFKFEIQQTVSI